MGTLPDGTEQMPFTAGMIDMEDGSFRVEEITMRSLSFPEPPTVISFYGTCAWNRASGGQEVMRITPGSEGVPPSITVPDGVDVSEAAKAVLGAVNVMLGKRAY